MHGLLLFGILFAFPLIHFELLQLKISRATASIPLILYALTIPLIFDEIKVFATFNMVILLRIAAIGQMDAKLLYSLTKQEYLEYFFAQQVTEKSSKVADLAPSFRLKQITIPYQYLSATAILKELAVLIGEYLMFCGLYSIVNHMKPNWQPNFMEMSYLTNSQDLVYFMLLGMGLCLILDSSFGLYHLMMSILLKVPFVPLMNCPYFSTSLKDFWTDRWNQSVTGSLKHAVFQPVLQHLFRNPYPLNFRKIPVWQKGIASLCTFFISGILHEWVIFVWISPTIHLEQLIFFLIQAVIVTLEVVIQHFVYNRFSIDLANRIPFYFSVIYSMTTICLLAPLFLNPYIRSTSFQQFIIF
jgi:hypothetical protein